MCAVQIRTATSRDIGALLRIESACFASEAWDAELFRDYLDISGDFFVIAKIGTRIAGYAIAFVGDRSAEIDSLAVLPEYRRRGVARALMNALLRQLSRSRIRICSLVVRRSNKAAIGLYRGFGFARVRTIQSYYPDGEHGWLMRREVA